MKSIEIIGYKRANLGKKFSKALRAEANVPCVLYGGGVHVHFYSPMFLFRDLVYTPETHTVLLNIEGQEYRCILQDIQFHPVSEVILHADFLLLQEHKPVKIHVPLRVVGTSPGVQAGGKLVIKQKKVKIKALPKNLPDYVEVDITGLELGKSIKMKDIVTKDYEILENPANPVLTIEVPRALKSKAGA
ncbi:MAG: 50S ribosomal protein L25/general stress protein Ctc [Microscillaceae bacterium]|nr:50S ribosomal protein L25/general stress protein Ctc [Microscillaceae bacterium]MDW8459988.1 50S ribosomal protein L25/general stress protein Ctc [Cytophagales bacterium]